MKKSVCVMLRICAALAAVHCADGRCQSIAPSAVNEKSPVLQPLSGTLFFSQQERAKMDRIRKSGVISADESSAQPAASRLNGFVKRSDGQSTIWVDGAARFNVQSDNIGRLQPMDVGGSSDTVRVRSASIVTRTVTPLDAKRLPSPKPARKNQTRRPAPKK